MLAVPMRWVGGVKLVLAQWCERCCRPRAPCCAPALRVSSCSQYARRGWWRVGGAAELALARRCQGLSDMMASSSSHDCMRARALARSLARTHTQRNVPSTVVHPGWVSKRFRCVPRGLAGGGGGGGGGENARADGGLAGGRCVGQPDDVGIFREVRASTSVCLLPVCVGVRLCACGVSKGASRASPRHHLHHHRLRRVLSHLHLASRPRHCTSSASPRLGTRCAVPWAALLGVRCCCSCLLRLPAHSPSSARQLWSGTRH